MRWSGLNRHREKGIANQGIVIGHSKHMPKQDNEQNGVPSKQPRCGKVAPSFAAAFKTALKAVSDGAAVVGDSRAALPDNQMPMF